MNLIYSYIFIQKGMYKVDRLFDFVLLEKFSSKQLREVLKKTAVTTVTFAHR